MITWRGLKSRLAAIDQGIFFFLGLAVLILWQALWPGYILTLDMTFTPQMKFVLSEGSFVNAVPIFWTLAFLAKVIPGWIIQKFMMLGLFFCLGYLPYRYFPRLWPAAASQLAAYFAGIFYLANPFVYTRFLAGHWTHLFAYAFLPGFLTALFVFLRQLDIRSGAKLAVWLWLIALFSLNFATMAALLASIIGVGELLRCLWLDRPRAWRLAKYGLSAGLIFTILSAYWLYPYFFGSAGSGINDFHSDHWEAYQTAGSPKLGVAGNVLALYGFWGEAYTWAGYFIWPKALPVLAISGGAWLIVLIALGAALAWQKGKQRLFIFGLIGFLAFIFACGIGETVFRSLNWWLFEHVSFWRGWRDTQKWSGWLALVYVWFAGLGVSWLGIKANQAKNYLPLILFVPLLYTYPIFGGFSRQLKPVWYPDSWRAANQLLDNDQSEYQVMFLPWHAYLSFDFNHRLIISNPAARYFDREIVQGENMEIGKVFSQNAESWRNDWERLLLKDDSGEIIDFLLENNYKYIIFSSDLTDSDIFKYSFLQSAQFQIKYQAENLTLFELIR